MERVSPRTICRVSGGGRARKTKLRQRLVEFSCIVLVLTHIKYILPLHKPRTPHIKGFLAEGRYRPPSLKLPTTTR